MRKAVIDEKDPLKLTYLYSPEPNEEEKVISFEDHELWIRELMSEEYNRYILEKGVFKELAETAKNHPPDLISKIMTINRNITIGMVKGGVSFRELSRFLIGAYQKECDEFESYLAEQQRGN